MERRELDSLYFQRVTTPEKSNSLSRQLSWTRRQHMIHGTTITGELVPTHGREDVSEETTEQLPPAVSPSSVRYISLERKQSELLGNFQSRPGTAAAVRDSFVTHNQQTVEPERTFNAPLPSHWTSGRIIHTRQRPDGSFTRPESPSNASAPRIFSKGSGDRRSHIECLPLPQRYGFGQSQPASRFAWSTE